MSLRGKRILLGVCGSIAAYKSAILLRLLKKEEADVRVIITPSASDFIGPLTLATLSGHPVDSSFVKNERGEWTNHVELGLWADIMLVAPLSAHTLSKMAHGTADNLLVATYLSARCPVMVAPAMDLDMYAHSTTQRNLQLLRETGNLIIDAEVGALASGLSGQGRMAEPENIVERIQRYFETEKDLKGRTIVITAGPTFEALDPVRFIGNHSSGKMGFALAEACAERGGQVKLISGPVSLENPHHPLIETYRVQTAEEMYALANELFQHADAGIMAAAVADYRPASMAVEKIKKKPGEWNLILQATPDIAASLGKLKKTGQVLIGFALETENSAANAKEKMHRKGFDFIVLNNLKDEGAGFGVDTNKVSIIEKDASETLPLLSKKEVARIIVDKLHEYLS
jgi:phosphopantothenoylcysteine decarboxylase/phosphopantothenate--cysteine ligase